MNHGSAVLYEDFCGRVVAAEHPAGAGTLLLHADGSNPKVLSVHGQVKQYRAPFLLKLHAALAADNIDFKVLYSEPTRADAARHDNVDLPANVGTKVKAYWCLHERLMIQPVLREIVNADLVILEQGNKYLANYLGVALSSLGLKRVAFWGHGRNHQATVQGLSELLKKHMLNKVDWWFAYTRGTAEYLARHGVARNIITITQNAIDTSGFQRDLAGTGEQQVAALRTQLGLGDSTRVGLFCGALHGDRRVAFLLEAARVIQRAVPDFHLVVIGGGPEADLVRHWASQEPWVHYVGPKFGAEKAAYFRLSEIFLMPGLVGLAILDAFSAGLPLLTTDIPIHSPEIEYLEDGVNGLKTAHSVQAYAQAVIEVFTDAARLQRLKDGAAACAGRYTIEAMVQNFRTGINNCLRQRNSG